MKKVVLTLFILVLAANSTLAQINLALFEAQKKSVLEAVKYTDESVKKMPTKPRLWYDRAVAYFDLASFPDSTVSTLDLEAPFKALEYLAEAVKLDTKDEEKGSIAMDAEKLLVGEAIIYGLAQIYKEAKEENTALAMLDRGLEIYPTNKDLRNDKFNMLISFNRISEAIKLLEIDINNGVNDFKSMYNLISLYTTNKEETKAKALYDKIISLYGIEKWEKENGGKEGTWEEEEEEEKEEIKNTVTEEKKESQSHVNDIEPPREEKKDVFSQSAIENSIPRIPLKLKNGFYNLASKSTGEIVDNINYDEVIPTYFNCFKVRRDDKWGLINSDGKLILPILEEGIIDDSYKVFISNKEGIDKRAGKKILDTNGGFVDNIVYDKNSFYVLNGDSKTLKKLKHYDDDSEWTNTFFDCSFNIFNYSAIVFEHTITAGEHDSYSIIDTSAKYLFTSKNEIKYIGEGLFCLKNNEGKYALINEKGDRLTPFRFIEIRKFNNNRALVELDNSYLEFIDKKGNTKIKLGNNIYRNDIKDFENYRSISNISIIDTLGQAMKLPTMPINSKLLVETFADDHFNFSANNLYGIIGKSGQIMVPPKYNSISSFKNGFAVIQKDEHFGIINSLGKEVIKPKYDQIFLLINNEFGEFKYNSDREMQYLEDKKIEKIIVFNDLIKVELNGESYFIDIKGNELVEK